MFRMLVPSLSSSVSFSRVDMRRIVMPRNLIEPLCDDGGRDVYGDGRDVNESAMECRREIVAAAAPNRFGIGGGILVPPNAIHAFGIVSNKWRSNISGLSGVSAAAKLNVPYTRISCLMYRSASCIERVRERKIKF